MTQILRNIIFFRCCLLSQRIHEGRDASGGQVLPDEPLCAVPVEAFGGVSDARKMYTCFVGEGEGNKM